MPRLHITPAACIGCNNCELACSFRFSEGKLPLRGRAITVARPATAMPGPVRPAHPAGQAGAGPFIPLTCLQCEEAACAKVCPAHALTRDPRTLAIEVDAGRCIGCGQCVAACPFGHIALDTSRGVALKCDLCHGAPTCAQFCPTDALVYR